MIKNNRSIIYTLLELYKISNIIVSKIKHKEESSMAAQFESLQPSFNQMNQLIQGIAKHCDDVTDATW